MASNFPTAYVRVASQTYVLQHILLLISLQNTTFLLLLSSNVGKVAEFWTLFYPKLLKIAFGIIVSSSNNYGLEWVNSV